ncbi:UDP-forming cellulose synthase catalytic subunit [Ancylobacter sp. FA202]|uniref:UDP-forming cellulose synthase catalytic subunit n=1 Tax=Ancylobacter sp. FA202 TaxID=1111106 RepID=UPI000475A57D|nr:UDP-forming cellulose synthase catalytic subunit [Ancylobacter sp. FA202]
MNRKWLTGIWVMLIAMVAFIITLPVNLQAQLVTGCIVILLIVFLKMFAPEGVPRMVALALGVSMVLRYVYWRTTSTLPPMEDLANFIPAVLLYSAEMYSVALMALSLFVVSSPQPPRIAPAIAPGSEPTVDIFVPSYNEDAGLLATTLAAASAIDYPRDRFTVWLLDDGGTDQKCEQHDLAAAREAQMRRETLTELCRELGVNYLTRPRNEHAKAGNLNHGLTHSSGELIVVFDADHAPARPFLRETIGYFNEDPRLFLVQTPHFFINPDPVERSLDTWRRMPSENEMFYGVIQRGLDRWGGAFFCGSAAVLRRKALQETNGFAHSSITEDCETALTLHARGWHSVYVDTPLIAGLQPETFASFIGQRSRWAQGMYQILRFHFPLFRSGLTIAQRICYMSSILFWFFPISRAIFLVAPFFYLFFSLEIFNGSGAEFVAYTAVYLLTNLFIQSYLYGKYRWPWFSELYEYIQTVYLLPALLSVMINPKKPTFKVTSKGETIDENRISEIGIPFFVIFVIQIVAVFVTFWRIATEPYAADITIVVGMWNLLNLIISGCALGVVSEKAAKRHSQRMAITRRCSLLIDGVEVPAIIDDVSMGGVRVRTELPPEAKARVGMHAVVRVTPPDECISDTLPVLVRNVALDEGVVVLGTQFNAKTAAHYQLIADLIFANADEWKKFQAGRRKNPGVLRGTVMFVMMAGFQTLRGLAYVTQLERLTRRFAPRLFAGAHGR